MNLKKNTSHIGILEMGTNVNENRFNNINSSKDSLVLSKNTKFPS